MHRTEDEWLAVRCQLGERDAFDLLVHRWHGPLSAYVRRIVASDRIADDVVQDAWLRIIRGIPRLRDPTRLRAWLFGIARRAVMDALRAKYDAPVSVLVDEIADVAVVQDLSDADAEAELTAMSDALALLPPIERDVLSLFYLQELTIDEMADVLAIPVGTVKSRLFRARNLMRARMKGAGT